MELYADNLAVSMGTVVLIRTRTAREKVKVNTNSVNESFVTGSRNTMAMIRGVSWALANCTAISRAEQTKTMNVNIDEAIIPRTARAVSGLMADSQPSALPVCEVGELLASASQNAQHGQDPDRIGNAMADPVTLKPGHRCFPTQLLLIARPGLSTATNNSITRISPISCVGVA